MTCTTCTTPRGTCRITPITQAPYGIRITFDGDRNDTLTCQLYEAHWWADKLLANGHKQAAAAILEAHKVALYHKHGHTNHVLDGGG